ncbi:hypothetical protein ACFODN_12935 [Rodentibacter caecimuris]|uniref:hypothetical protein n=1 Tax=Rodentibacter caecimuris TaxID=1796644 RepID=UPI00360E88D2
MSIGDLVRDNAALDRLLALPGGRGLPIETIYVVGNIAQSEALAVKGITDPRDLVGKKIATPVSDTSTSAANILGVSVR